MKVCTVCEHEEFWHKERDNGFKLHRCTKNSCICIKFSQSQKVTKGRICGCPCHNSTCVNLCRGCSENKCFLYLGKTERVYSHKDKEMKRV